MEVYQVAPTLDINDAVSNYVLEINKLLKANGYDTKIFTLHCAPELISERLPIKYISKHISKHSIILYHYPLHSDISCILKNIPNKKALIYHNITPSKFFKYYDDELYNLCQEGIEKLAMIKDDYQLGVGVSEFNRYELEQIGFKKTEVLPIILDKEKYQNETSELYSRLNANNTVNFIFVGRISPNKKQEDIIKTFYYYHKYINKNSKLYLIGKKQILKYVSELKNFINKLKIADDVIFTGSVNDTDLVAYYKSADVFLCMSEHEGFCVPLLEAMYFQVPIIAFNATGVPYTLGDSGILVNRKNYIEIAELINLIIEDHTLRKKIIEKQNDRLHNFNEKATTEKLLKIINDLSD